MNDHALNVYRLAIVRKIDQAISAIHKDEYAKLELIADTVRKSTGGGSLDDRQKAVVAPTDKMNAELNKALKEFNFIV